MNLELKNDIKIENMIYEIRGQQVMLDSDLAKLYQCKNGTKEINQAVKNNPDKFPKKFIFRINENDYNFLKSKILTSKGGSRKGHTAFTEEGVAMLATIIHTKVATEVSIRIMEAFVSMRHFLIDNKDIYKSINYINNKIIEYDDKFDYIFSKFDKKEQLYLCGTSINNIGNKTFMIIKLIDDNIKNTLLENINDIISK